MNIKINLNIPTFKTALFICLFCSGHVFADLSNDVKWNANLVVVEAAIKAGDKLTSKECKELIDQLFSTEHPYYCPHGRPIIVNLSIEDLDKRFERH